MSKSTENVNIIIFSSAIDSFRWKLFIKKHNYYYQNLIKEFHILPTPPIFSLFSLRREKKHLMLKTGFIYKQDRFYVLFCFSLCAVCFIVSQKNHKLNCTSYCINFAGSCFYSCSSSSIKIPWCK